MLGTGLSGPIMLVEALDIVPTVQHASPFHYLLMLIEANTTIFFVQFDFRSISIRVSCRNVGNNYLLLYVNETNTPTQKSIRK